MNDESSYYNYGQNYASLDSILRAHGSATEFGDHMNKAITALSPVFEGETAQTVQTTQQHCNNQIDGVLTNILSTHGQAVQSQGDMAALDARCAGGLT
jgi:uncharacterized protein YukE